MTHPKQSAILAETLSIAEEIYNNAERATALRAIFSLRQFQSPVLFAKALTLARTFDDEATRGDMLIVVASLTDSNDEQVKIFAEALPFVLATTTKIQLDHTSSYFDSLTAAIPKSQHTTPLAKSLYAAQQIHNREQRFKAFGAISERLIADREQASLEVLEIVKNIEDEYARSVALIATAKYLLSSQSSLFDEVARIALKIGNKSIRIYALAAIAEKDWAFDDPAMS